ncbi:MAG TPA: hypothetical protein DCS91_01370 [Microcoleaceae bacterium UBA11344]|nr:hypothetical protein [Microcoleaceae cyanobacterium UBA11344]
MVYFVGKYRYWPQGYSEVRSPFPPKARASETIPKGIAPLSLLTKQPQTFSANLKTFFPKPLKSKVL